MVSVEGRTDKEGRGAKRPGGCGRVCLGTGEDFTFNKKENGVGSSGTDL